MTNNKPREEDIQLGIRLRKKRLNLGLSQDELARKIGLTFQQIQKYERGTNRISVSRLLDLCKALSVNADYFLKGLTDDNEQQVTHEEATADIKSLRILKHFRKLDQHKQTFALNIIKNLGELK